MKIGIVKILALILMVGNVSFGQEIENNKKIKDGEFLRIRPYSFPTYENAYGYTRFDGSQDDIQKYWSKDEYSDAVSDSSYEFQKLIYSSDGYEVVTYVYKPKHIKGKPLPAIIFNRGSANHNDLAPVLIPFMHRLAKKGYVVFAPMYRQSDGGEGKDQLGGDDVHDLLNMVPLLETLKYVDKENMFMSGESRGGMMTLQAIREGFPIKAAAIWGAFYDMEKVSNPQLLEYAKQNWGFSSTNPSEDFKKRSVAYWPEKITTPLLIMHGERDNAIPTQNALDIASSLQKNNKLYSLIIFADDDHILSKNQLERDYKSIEWFEKFNTDAVKQTENWLKSKANEEEINNYGYDLISRGNIDNAIKIFKIFVQRFPKNPNAYDSLGEALVLKGDIQEGIKNYKIALKLTEDPDDKERIENIILKLND
ncbi:MAG TPA: prolyl oligopeptidase family serine peptidase [Gillisia sp.]|nr:prolyl oligopeptidase family serine peptidase [Gillisia sp.]